jgi:uncharacterized protein YjbJ (UPF0337 family)
MHPGMSARNKLNHRAQYWSGRAKETVGRLTGNRRAQREGVLDQVKANLKDQRERMRDTFRGRGSRP